MDEEIEKSLIFCMSSLHRNHANIPNIVPILVYVLLKSAPCLDFPSPDLSEDLDGFFNIN